MLILNLADIGHGPVGIQDAIPADDAIWGDTRFELREPLSTDLEAHAVGEGVYVRGRIWTELDAACRRCLETVHLEVDEQLDLYFERVGDRDEDDEDDEVYPLPADAKELDLKPVILEQMLLRVPEFVVCQEACRGLCPQCGANLNETSCDCTPTEPDSPWDALKALKFD